MRPLRLTVVLLVGFTSATLLKEARAVDLEVPGGVVWHKKSRIVVERPLSMTGPLALQADEVVIQAPIVTNGFSLDIESRKLFFQPGGRIESFDKPLPALTSLPPDFPGPAGVGEPGQAGKQGLSGLDGKGAHADVPGEISVFTADLEGNPAINGTGQTGGVGGRGGRGQTGGTGTQGHPARASLNFFSNRYNGGAGGKGGAYGKGGKGGVGGQGGSAVPVSFLMSRDWTAKDSHDIKSQPGTGGVGGEPGLPGAPGPGGPGGPGDEACAWFICDTRDGGPPGPPGDPVPFPNPTTEDQKAAVTLGHGTSGPAGPGLSVDIWKKAVGRETPLLVKTFATFESLRYHVTESWFEAHWWRLFELVTRSSTALLVHDDASKSDEALGDLLGGDLDTANLKLVADRWRKAFLRPLQRQAEIERHLDPKRFDRIERILKIAEPYTKTLEAANRRGAISPGEVTALKTAADAASQGRSSQFTAAVGACGDYFNNVLSQAEYQQLLKKRQGYFEVPVCREAREFLEASGAQHDIQISVPLVPAAGLKQIAALKVTEVDAEVSAQSSWRGTFEQWLDYLWGWAVPSAHADAPFEFVVVPVSPAKLRPEQWGEFHPLPQASTAVKSLGLHTGYRYPKRPLRLEDLAAFLDALQRVL